jgi:hypothetical protein
MKSDQFGIRGNLRPKIMALIKKKLVEILHGLPWIMLLGHWVIFLDPSQSLTKIVTA